MLIFYKKWKKYNELQLTESKMDLNIRKMTNHPPSPATINIFCMYNITCINFDITYYLLPII